MDLNFSIQPSGQNILLLGQTVIDRLLWNIGAGAWQDTTWVGKDITVKVRVSAKY